MTEARRSALYDAGKPKAKTESKPAAAAAPSGDERVATHKKARDDMHKRHRTERRDMHGRHRDEHDQMHARHDKEIAALDAQQDAAMLGAAPGASPPGPAPVAAAGNVADSGGAPAPAGG